MLDSPEGKYIVPRATGTGDPLIVDIAAVVKAEARLQEVAFVNAHTAAELLTVFNENWSQLNDAVTLLTHEHNQAKDVWARSRAEALLNCTDDTLRKRGHTKSSQDLRDALVETDLTVIAAKERLEEIKTVLSYISGKAEKFLNAYTSVKKLTGTMFMPPEPPRAGPAGPVPKSRDRIEAESAFDEDKFEMPEGFQEPRY